jgi:hypothetical protein
MEIVFDAGPHTYHVDGKRLPSVTEVLRPIVDLSGIPVQILENARWRGTLAHTVCDLDNRDALGDVEDLDPAALEFLGAWRQWKERTGAVVIHSEFPVASKEYGYAGTIDVVADIRSKLTLVDLKATALIPSSVGPQTAAYARAFQETTGQKIKARGATKRHAAAALHIRLIMEEQAAARRAGNVTP